MAAWLSQPVTFDSGHTLSCERFTPEQCNYYKEHWHNWYVADWAFALPTVAFFMCIIGVFILGHIISQLLASSRKSGPSIWRKAVAVTRYLAYRGFYIRALGWNSAPVGLLLLGAIGSIYFFCMDLVPSPYYWPGPDKVWGNSPPLGTRSGWLALACMPFLFATASKANWITLVTGVSHEKLQLFHRWIAYAFLFLALMHTFPFIVWHIRNHDMVHQFNVSNIFEYWTGIVALLFQAWLTAASWGPIRNLGYEFFKAAHFFSAVVFMVIFFWHCAGTLTSWHYFVATAAIYIPCWTYPWLRTLFEYGSQKAQIFVEDDSFTRITIPANFSWQPGQHCFLRFPAFGISALTSHPFSICSLPSITSEKPSELTFYVRHRGGFTARLYNYAKKRAGVQVPVLVDGPYGGINNQKYFGSDRLVVVAGGAGAPWSLPFIEQFLRHLSSSIKSPDCSSLESQEGKQASDEPPPPRQLVAGGSPRSLRVIIATRDIETRTWFYTALDHLLSEHKSLGTRLGLNVEVHLTGEPDRVILDTANPDLERSDNFSTDDGDTPKSARVEHQKLGADGGLGEEDGREEMRGRPNLPSIIREEAAAAAETGDTTAVFVCGPLSMQNDVRNAVADENLDVLRNSTMGGGMYLHLEHFSWA